MFPAQGASSRPPGGAAPSRRPSLPAASPGGHAAPVSPGRPAGFRGRALGAPSRSHLAPHGPAGKGAQESQVATAPVLRIVFRAAPAVSTPAPVLHLVRPSRFQAQLLAGPGPSAAAPPSGSYHTSRILISCAVVYRSVGKDLKTSSWDQSGALSLSAKAATSTSSGSTSATRAAASSNLSA